jgi:methionine synthase II (cobalamin-independent)
VRLTKPERIPRYVRGKRDRWFYVDHDSLIVCHECGFAVTSTRIPLSQLKRAIAAVERSRKRQGGRG